MDITNVKFVFLLVVFVRIQQQSTWIYNFNYKTEIIISTSL